MKNALTVTALTGLLGLALLPGSAFAHGPMGKGASGQVVTTTTTTTTRAIHPHYLALHHAHSRGGPQHRHESLPRGKQQRRGRPEHSRHSPPQPRVVVVKQAPAQPVATLRIHLGYDLPL